jgi:hypothetical protein
MKKEIIIFIASIGIVAVMFVAGASYLKVGAQVIGVNLRPPAITKIPPAKPKPSPTPSITPTPTKPAPTSTKITTTTATSTQVIPPATVVPPDMTVTSNIPFIAPTSTPPIVVVPKPLPPPTPPAQSTTIKSLPYSIGTFGDRFGKTDDWSSWWGNISKDNGLLAIGASASTTGGGALLTGSDAWGDYTFQATIDWQKGETFGLVARYKDDNNYVVCEFDEKYVGTVHMRLEQHVDGRVIDLADGDVQNYNQMGGSGITAVIQVSGTQGACAFNYHTISSLLTGDELQAPFSGQIGFTTWDPTENNSAIVVENIGVTNSIYYLGGSTGNDGNSQN